jgi:hypothetical protein
LFAQHFSSLLSIFVCGYPHIIGVLQWHWRLELVRQVMLGLC